MFFKTVEERIKDLGFVETYRSDTVMQFERKNNEFNFIHGVDLVKKSGGNTSIIQSFQKDSPIPEFDYMVGLDVEEARLFLKLLKKHFKKGE